MHHRTRRRLTTALLVLLVSGTAAATLTPVAARAEPVAAPVAAPVPRLVLDPPAGAPGDLVTATGSGFPPGGSVHVDAGGSGVVQGDGTARIRFQVPYLSPGTHAVWMSDDAAGGRAASAPLVIREDWTQTGGGPGHRNAAVFAVDPARLTPTRVGVGVDGPPAPGSGAVVAGGAVYAVSSGGVVRSHSPTGDLRWSRDVDGDVVGSPVVAGDRVVVVERTGVVTALDPAFGRYRWSTDLGGAVSVGAVADRGRLVVGTDDGRVVLLDLATGAVRWTATRPGAVTAVPAIVDATVVVARGAEVSSVSLATGGARWTRSVGGTGVTGAVTVESVDRVLVVSPGVGLVGLNGRNGRIDWTVPRVRAPFGVAVRSAVVHVEQQVTGGVNLVTVSTATGAVQRRDRTVVPASTGGLTVTGRDTSVLVFSARADGTVRAFDPFLNRSLDWQTAWPGETVAAPVVAVDGRLWVLTSGGGLHRLGA